MTVLILSTPSPRETEKRAQGCHPRCLGAIIDQGYRTATIPQCRHPEGPAPRDWQ